MKTWRIVVIPNPVSVRGPGDGNGYGVLGFEDGDGRGSGFLNLTGNGYGLGYELGNMRGDGGIGVEVSHMLFQWVKP